MRAQPNLRATVPARSSFLLDEYAVDDLVIAVVLGDRQQISDRR